MTWQDEAVNGLRALVMVALLMALAACAGNGTRTPPPDAGRDAVAADADSATLAGAEEKPHYGLAPEDPWERFNRGMFAFNDTFDRILLRPVAKGYATVTPRPLRTGISNFFTNLQQPLTGINLLLQGHPGQAGSALGRFALNAFLGLGGVLDPATDVGIPLRDRGFGQTLAKWGWLDSRYLVLPLFGPSTVRDGIGKGVNASVSPITWLAGREGAEVSLLYGVDARASVLPYEAMMEGAADRYLLIRDAYLQRRRCQIIDCSGEMPDYLLPDYEFEIPDFDTLRN